MGDSEAEKLERYLAEKAKQDQEEEHESEPLSAYDACVLKESGVFQASCHHQAQLSSL